MRPAPDRLIRQLPARAGVAIGYVVALIATTLLFRGLPADGRRAWLAWTSTNLENLGDHPLRSLVVSGLFSDGGLVGWALTAAVGLGVTNWALGNWRTAALIAGAHVGGTLISQGILAYRIAGGQAPVGDRSIVDVGPSYVVACALVAGALYGLGAQRLPAVVCFGLFAPNAFLGLPTLQVASVGHLCAVVFAVAVGWPLWRSGRPRVADPSPGSGAGTASAPVVSRSRLGLLR
ncbi:rhomboid-like protein [Planosporangium sp. 12N6]|uniref:rhomboid-like protein n=1 Tax=Planosporangium spinosum TaxID=3402278 RepID=UPI003CF9722D